MNFNPSLLGSRPLPLRAFHLTSSWLNWGFVYFFCLTSLAAQESTEKLSSAELQNYFWEAHRAYNHGHFKHAVAQYSHLLDLGYFSVELFFNLGKAYHEYGDKGRAVLNYRRAWYLAPRDEDVLIHLRSVWKDSHTLTPFPPVLERIILRCSLSEWIAMAVTFYWLSAIALGFLIVSRHRRNVKITLLIGLCFGLIWSLVAAGYWSSLYHRPEMVTFAPIQPVFSAPTEDSPVHFKIPAGSIVRLEKGRDSWFKIDAGKQTGWISQASCGKVYPWHGGENPFD